MTRDTGYVEDVAYPALFHREMLPVWLAALTRFQGFAAPDLAAPFSYCELGCGSGLSLLVAAAAHPHARFVGVDFNAQHLALALDAARACGLDNVTFVHADFAAFAHDNRTPYDFIACHGVWSWIAPRHQQALLACVRQFLKPGGVFFLHYMCHPGSTDMAPVQQFLKQFAMHAQGSSTQKAQSALDVLMRMARGGLYADKPGMDAKLQALAKLDPGHLAHEFLSDHWQPQHSVDVHRQMGEAGLPYLGSADVFNNLDISLSIPGNFQGLIRRITEPALAETVKDLVRNNHQRMDLFLRDPRPLSEQDHLAQLGATVFALLPGHPAPGPLSFSTQIGPIDGPAEVFTPLLRQLSQGPASFAQLAALPAFAQQPGLLFQSLQMLMLRQIAHPLKPVSTPDNIRSRQLTQWLARHDIAIRLVDECGTAIQA